jgi:hypothetical protein
VRLSPTRLLKDMFSTAYPDVPRTALTTDHLLPLTKPIANMRLRQNVSRMSRIVFDLLA